MISMVIVKSIHRYSEGCMQNVREINGVQWKSKFLN